MKQGLEKLASNAFRTSPRSGQVNQEVLDQCAQKTREIEKFLSNKAKYSRNFLKRASLPFQVLELSHRRMVLLTGAVDMSGSVNATGVVRPLLALARRHFRILWEELSSRSAAPLILELPFWPGAEDLSLPMLLRREEACRLETITLIDRAVASFSQDRALIGKLLLVRKDLVDSRGILKPMATEMKIINSRLEILTPGKAGN